MSLVFNIEDREGFVRPKPKAISLNIKRVKPLIKFLVKEGVHLKDILADTGLDQTHLLRRDIFLDSQQHHKLLLNAIKHSNDMSFAAKLGEQDFINNDSLLACRVMSCDTVNEAMRMLSYYDKLWTNQFDLKFETDNRWGIFSITPHIDFGPALPFYIEYLYAILYAFGSYCLGEKNIPLIFEFSYPEPENSDYYGTYFSNNVRFNQAQNRVLLPLSVLARRPIFSDQELARENDQNAQDKMQCLIATDIVSRTRAIIDKSALSTLCLENIARQLCMSSRSLRRHLQQEGHSFQGLVDEQRRNTAKHLLTNHNKSVQEIAILLGYNDASSFSRAFKRWEQLSPKEYQQKQNTRT